MKRMYALLTAIMMAAAIALPSHASSKSLTPAAIQDTLILKLKNEARLLVVVKDVKDLKYLKNQSIDSVMVLLEKYADQIEAAGKKGDEVTVTIDKSKANTSEDVNITIAQNGPGGTEVTITEKKRIRITDRVGIDIDHDEDKNSTKVKVNVGASDSVETRKKDEERYKNRNPKSDFDFQIDLGVSNWLNQQALPGASITDIELRPLASRYISLNSKWAFRVGGQESPVRLNTGFTFDFHNYMFDDNIVITANEGGTQFFKATDFSVDKSKLATSSITVPLELGFDFKNKRGKTDFKIGGGGFVGYMLNSHSKLKYSQNGENHKSKTKDDFYLNDFQYGLTGFVGIRSLEFFVKYNLNELFEENKGPKANAIAAGVRILKF